MSDEKKNKKFLIYLSLNRNNDIDIDKYYKN